MFFEDLTKAIRRTYSTCYSCGANATNPMHSRVERVRPFEPDSLGNLRLTCRKHADREQNPEIYTKAEWKALGR